MESYRGWNLKGGFLHSYSHDMTWDSPTVTATCMHGCETAFCIANHHCACGIYSRKDLKLLLKEYADMDIYGIIYNHGVVFEGASGLRAEKATIRALFTADIAQGKILAKNYPGVAILMPPPEVLELSKKQVYHDNWQQRYQKTRLRIKAMADAMDDAKSRYPGGFNAEKERLGRILKNKTRQEIIQFAKEYAAIDEWAARVNGGKIESRTKKAKPGDMVFEANNTMHPYVFIGSCRPNQYASMRYMFDRNGVLVRRPNIRRWDEEPGLMAARKQAIEEWS